MFNVGDHVMSLHGSKGFVWGEIKSIEGDQARLAVTQLADVNMNKRKPAPHELHCSTLLRFCTIKAFAGVRQ